MLHYAVSDGYMPDIRDPQRPDISMHHPCLRRATQHEVPDEGKEEVEVPELESKDVFGREDGVRFEVAELG